jgi:hypothetical protein
MLNHGQKLFDGGIEEIKRPDMPFREVILSMMNGNGTEK